MGRPDASDQRVGALTLLTSLAPLSWGTTFVVTSELLPSSYPLMSTVLRALPAGLVLLACTQRLPSRSWWIKACVLGLLNIAIFNALLFVAAYRLPGGVAATLNATQPLFVAAFALFLLGDRPTRWRLGWSLVGVVGVGLMVLRGDFDADVVGLGAGVVAAAVMAAGIVLTKKWGRPHGATASTLAAWQLTGGGLLIAPVALVIEGPPPLDGPAFAGYVWLGVVGTLLAYVLWFHGIAKLPVVAVSFLTLLSPVTATGLGWLVLDQALTAWQGIGFFLALAAVAAAQISPREVLGRLRPTPTTTI